MSLIKESIDDIIYIIETIRSKACFTSDDSYRMIGLGIKCEKADMVIFLRIDNGLFYWPLAAEV